MAEATCDLCGRALGRMEPQYIATIDIRPTIGLVQNDEDLGDRDHLLEIHEMLEGAEEAELREPADDSTQNEFLMCHECCRRFAEDPLPRKMRARTP